MFRHIAVLALLPVPVLAQDLTYSDRHSATCLAAGSSLPEREACIGLSANACMEDTMGGYSTAGMVGCLSLELDWWDARLNRVYSDAMAAAKANDREMGAGDNGVPSMAAALKAMQRAWIPYRDAKCDYERSFWGGGTGGGPAALGCLLNLTAKQALYLEFSGPGG
ncbi:MAG: DUF1311 domain-containing protein [Rhodobacteraceae bacterium]|nr:DUF1311 domain-containing protein [Paracoccaceae bacterium]